MIQWQKLSGNNMNIMLSSYNCMFNIAVKCCYGNNNNYDEILDVLVNYILVNRDHNNNIHNLIIIKQILRLSLENNFCSIIKCLKFYNYFDDLIVNWQLLIKPSLFSERKLCLMYKCNKFTLMQ